MLEIILVQGFSPLKVEITQRVMDFVLNFLSAKGQSWTRGSLQS